MIRRRGFTLIEILVALVIVAIVGVSAQQRVGQFFDDRQRLLDRQEAHWYAWNLLMQQYQEAKGWRANNEAKLERSGHDSLLGREWYYRIDQQATVNEHFFRVEVEVFDAPIQTADILQQQINTTNLVMFLVQ